MTLEELLDGITTSGFFVNNLFQRIDGGWQANLRDNANSFWEFGYGDTAFTALLSCLDKAANTKSIIGQRHALVSSIEPAGNTTGQKPVERKKLSQLTVEDI